MSNLDEIEYYKIVNKILNCGKPIDNIGLKCYNKNVINRNR